VVNRRDFFRFVRADSSAVVKKQFGVAGDSFFEITRGQGRPLPEKMLPAFATSSFKARWNPRLRKSAANPWSC
jgi:hypothetical protein